MVECINYIFLWIYRLHKNLYLKLLDEQSSGRHQYICCHTQWSDICTCMFMYIIIYNKKLWKNKQIPIVDELIKKLWHMHIMKYQSFLKMREFYQMQQHRKTKGYHYECYEPFSKGNMFPLIWCFWHCHTLRSRR